MSRDLDHVALGLRAAQPVIDALAAGFGGLVLHGGTGRGFRGVQMRFGGGGMVIELLQPHDIETTDFLERFLTVRGEGPHHLTFLVADLAAEIERLRNLGLTPLGVQLVDPVWKECFLDPGQAHGTVVQIAQMSPRDDAALREDGWPWRWWRDPPLRGDRGTALRRVVIGAPSPTETIAFFTTVLGGKTDAGDLLWPGGGRVRVEHRNTPGIDRLEVTGLSRPVRLGGTLFAPTPE